MRPNKFGCTWLGQGGALKVVSEGFGSAMMLKDFFSDSMIQIFLPKTAEKLKILWGFVGQHFAVWGAILSHTTENNSSRYAFWRVPHTTPRIRTLRTDLLYAPKASVSGVWSQSGPRSHPRGLLVHPRVNRLHGNPMIYLDLPGTGTGYPYPGTGCGHTV